MFRDRRAIYNKFNSLSVGFTGFIEFQNFSPTEKPVDQRRGQVKGGQAGGVDNGRGGASSACYARALEDVIAHR
jgi:hypothetical protein